MLSKDIGVVLVCVAVVAASPLGCAKGGAEFEDADDGAGGTTSAGGGGTGGIGGANNQGGSTSSSGGTGDLCDMDCDAIDTLPCSVAVCNDGSYPGTIGSCVVVDAPPDTECDDGLFCTVNDHCVAGQCTGGPPNLCGEAPDACEVIVCDEADDSCHSEPATEGNPCQPTEPCKVNGVCTNGLCVGADKDCTFAPIPNDCYTSACNPQNSECEPEPIPGNQGAACIDNNDLCTVDKVCDGSGNCIGGTPMDCSQLTQGCFNGACNPVNGTCFEDPIPDGQECDAASDECNQGICNAGSCDPVPLGDGTLCPSATDDCNQGSCVAGSCAPTAINDTLACDDGLNCTANTTCDAGVCGGGSSIIDIYFFEDFSSNAAGWTLGSEWQIAPAQASTGHSSSCGNGDPAEDHTGTQDNGVAGVVIGGNAADAVHDYYYLTSPVVDTSAAATVWLEYWRWLNSDYPDYMHNHVQVFDGVSWVDVWSQPDDFNVIEDATWTPFAFDISAYKNAQMQVRFGFDIGSTAAFTCSQWNVDDVLIASAACVN